MVPFHVAGKAVGTIWAMMHSDRRRFDAEDERVMTALGQFASLAHQTVDSIQDLKVEIAAREKAEATLRALTKSLEAKVQRLVEANVIGIVIFDLQGKVSEANEAFLRIVQYSREDLVTGRVRWTDLTPAEWSERDHRAIGELKATGIFQPYEKEYFRKDGSRAPVLLGGALFEHDGRRGRRLRGRFERTKARPGRFAKGGAAGTVDCRLRSGRRREHGCGRNHHGLEQGGGRIFGWSRSEALGRRMSETIIPIRYRSAHERGLQQFFQTGEGPVLNTRIEISALRRNGEEFPVELSITPLKFGETWIFSAFLRDISERLRSEEQLRQERVEPSPDDGNHSRDAVERGSRWRGGLLQRARAGIHRHGSGGNSRRRLDENHSCGGPAQHRAGMGALGPHRRPFYAEFRSLRGSDGMYRWCVARALPLRGFDGFILKWYGTIVDFHDRRQAQEDLRNTQAELAHVNRVMTMGELAASIAHEVSQPLASIMASGESCTAWLANDPPNLERARAAASRVIQAATQASEIVQRIRALFKKTTASATSVNVNAVIEETVSLLRHETQRHNISLRIELDADVPAVRADRVQLQQVILNLVMNAIESTASIDREPKRLLIQSTLPNPRELQVSVKDTGPGIDAQQAEKLFTPFFTTKPHGIGMGLPISRSIIEAHGGTPLGGEE